MIFMFMFSVVLKQRLNDYGTNSYAEDNYGDVGYLFLLVDLRSELPIIHVRAWQNDKLPLGSLIELNDFY